MARPTAAVPPTEAVAAPALSGVTVSEDLGAEPTVEFTAPLQISEADAEVIVPGDGAAIAEGDTIIWRHLYIDASSGETLQSWWQGAPAGGVQVNAEAVGPAAFEVFTSMTVGSRFAMAGWQQDQSGQARSLLQVADVDRVVEPLRAEGKAGRALGDIPEGHPRRRRRSGAGRHRRRARPPRRPPARS